MQFFIDALDDDARSGETEVLIDRFPIDLELELGAALTERTTYTGFYNIPDLGFDMSFRVQCSENYYGPNCATFCEEVEDVYTCDSEGRGVCLLHIGRDSATNCTTCRSEWDPETNCTTCLSSFYDIQANCTQCIAGRDVSTKCTTCLPGYDPSNNCTECLTGRDINMACEKCLLPGYDPSNDCTQCVAGRNISTNCTECLSGYDPSTNCTTQTTTTGELKNILNRLQPIFFFFLIQCHNIDSGVTIPNTSASSAASNTNIAVVGGAVGGAAVLLILLLVVLCVVIIIMTLQLRRQRRKFTVAGELAS